MKQWKIKVRQANKKYIWFHLADLPSCHGIINCTNENLSAALMSHIRLNYIPSYKKDNLDNDSDGKVDNASEVIDVNSTGIIFTLQYNF